MISCFEGAAVAYLFQKWHFVFQDNFHHHFKIEGNLDKNCNDFFCLFVRLVGYENHLSFLLFRQLNILVDTGSSNFAVAGVPDPDVTSYFNTEL